MKDYILVIDISWLFQNICRAILSGEMISECAMHIDDVDIFCSQQTPVALVIGEHSYDRERWEKMLLRNPKVRQISKIFIAKKGQPPSGFLSLNRPFRPNELLSKLCDSLSTKRSKCARYEGTSDRTAFNRRIFERNAVKATAYLDDEFGEHLLEMPMRDLSLGGAFLEGSIPLKKGSMSFISFELEGKEISVTGQIMRVTNEGLGIRFMGLEENARDAIARCGSNVS